MEFVTNLHFPHTDAGTAVPDTWNDDAPAAGAEAFGFLIRLLTHVRPDRVTPLPEIKLTRHPDDLPAPVLVGRLVKAGYLCDQGDGRYSLVHPERLGPLPA